MKSRVGDVHERVSFSRIKEERQEIQLRSEAWRPTAYSANAERTPSALQEVVPES